MTRRRIIAGNWKMYKTQQEAELYIRELSPLVAAAKPFVFLAVPFTAIETAANAARKTNICIGAQNMHDATSGAFTGEIAASMLKAAGAEFVILGHSERRELFHETDDFINKKLKRALIEDIHPILCVGETEEQREKKQTEKVIQNQIIHCLEGIAKEEAISISIAYEPIWAIGTGKTATPLQAEKVHAFIRTVLGDLYGKRVAEKISILYGGSVKPENISSLITKPNIDGALVGGASLDPESFAKIINQS